jgi:hypothetical protein
MTSIGRNKNGVKHMNEVTKLIPRPFRDIITSELEIREFQKACTKAKPGSAEWAILGICGGGDTLARFSAEAMIKAAARLGLVALGAFAAISSAPVALGVGAVLAGLTSLPALMIAGGGALVVYGSASVCASLATGSFLSLGLGLASLTAGWISLEYHNMIPFGLAEKTIINPLAEAFAGPLAQAIR